MTPPWAGRGADCAGCARRRGAVAFGMARQLGRRGRSVWQTGNRDTRHRAGGEERDGAVLSAVDRGHTGRELFGRGALHPRCRGARARKWTDITGRVRPVAGGVAGPQWWTNWGSADVGIGRSSYAPENDGGLIASDSILQPG